MKLNILISILISICAGELYGDGVKTYYNYHENFNNEPVTALSAYTGNSLFGFLPVDIDNIDSKIKFLFSVSPYVKQEGEMYGRDVSNSENIDLLKNFSIVWNHRKDFMPFLAYYTPYKAVLNNDGFEEIIKKRDAISIGILSDQKKHQVGLSFDMLMSTYKVNQNDNGGEYIFRRGGFSAVMYINAKVNKRSSMFISAVSPVFLDFDIDDNENGSEKDYFDKFHGSAGFNYKLNDFYAVYSFIYRNFEKYYDDDDGLQLTYPWVSEHNFVVGYNLDKNLKLSLDYQLLPSVFTENMPDIGDVYRHTIGIFAGIEFENIILNARYADSKLLSDESVARTYFQADIIYKLK
ncbi:TPA: hypothetical protein DCR49_02205 [Candidatus Delongbacteria bacterium]|nr:MAG: hypothetical protein A2Y39_00065 [Candidatus Delongbacteria bacterium GWF2_40_14]HAQ60809.1 hypothetical protein [Candidatus Delongbacteria bacterium]